MGIPKPCRPGTAPRGQMVTEERFPSILDHLKIKMG